MFGGMIIGPSEIAAAMFRDQRNQQAEEHAKYLASMASWTPIRRALAGGDAYKGAVSGEWGGGTLLTGLTEKKMKETESMKLSKISLLGR